MTTRLVNCLANEHIQQKHCGTVQQAWSCKRYANQCPSNRKQSNRTTNGPRTSECEHPERSSSDMPLGSLCSARFNVMAPMRAPQCIGATRESLRRLTLKTIMIIVVVEPPHVVPYVREVLTQCPHNAHTMYTYGAAGTMQGTGSNARAICHARAHGDIWIAEPVQSMAFNQANVRNGRFNGGRRDDQFQHVCFLWFQ